MEDPSRGVVRPRFQTNGAHGLRNPAGTNGVNTSRSRDGNQRWRPPWWSSDGSNKDNTNKENHHFKYNSPFTYVPVKKIGKIPGEGICINLFQRSI
ncbi:unnamed protein product, partial [Schistosoma curassoni]|uniref:Uncharacterized protein n=1 Tax=Schistosoma curassoni TaxID=6186 RepID=A0A183JJB6_9TREM